jgi:hypothetical protein
MKKSLLFGGVGAFLMGCSTVPDKIDPNYALYVTTSKETAIAAANKRQEPLFTMKGIPGQTIKLEGVAELTIYMPEIAGNRNTPAIAPYVPPRNEAVEMVKAIGGVVTPIGAILATGKATTDLATAVGNAANHGYQYIQAPQPNQIINGTGVIGSGTLTQNTISGTGVIGSGNVTIETLSGTGTLGGGSYTTNDLGGTGSIGGDYTDSHDVTESITEVVPPVLTP